MDSRAGVAIAWLERWQIPLYLLALVAGAAIGLTAPATAPAFEQTINPVLIALLYATFLSVPLTRLGQALRNGRFLAGLLVLNFALVPVLVYGLSRFVAHDQALLLGRPTRPPHALHRLRHRLLRTSRRRTRTPARGVSAADAVTDAATAGLPAPVRRPRAVRRHRCRPIR